MKGKSHMLEKVRQVLGFQLTIAELIGLSLILGTPYLLVGVVWSATHTEHLHRLHGAGLALSFLGSIMSWPVLLCADVCIT